MSLRGRPKPVSFLELWRRTHQYTRPELSEAANVLYDSIANVENGRPCREEDAHRLVEFTGIPMPVLSSAVVPALNVNYITTFNYGAKRKR